MLPSLRIVPVGGAILAILIVGLALEPPGSPRPTIARHGALIAAEDHPEWRQFLIQAALRRADELQRLRDLPDTPTRTLPNVDKGKVAVLPTDRANSEPDDQTGTISETPAVTIPIDIGEPSRFELPVAIPEEKQPAVKPVPNKTPSASRKKARRPIHRPRAAAKPQPPVQTDPFANLFGGQRYQPPAAAGVPQTAVSGADRPQ